MTVRQRARKQKDRLDALLFKLRSGDREAFECPICGYTGPFMDVNPSTGRRKHARCPRCSSLERHRIQFLVVEDVLRAVDTRALTILHVAPEPFFRAYFSQRFGGYESADLSMPGVDHRVDLQQLPFDDATYDVVYASHVLEHVPDDEKALAEIRRILRPGGIAILPVPIVAERTVEYPEPNPHESYHVRAPGYDYVERYQRHFAKVATYRSDALPPQHQLFIFEDRSRWPTAECPLRPSMAGDKHIDIVPVCFT